MSNGALKFRADGQTTSTVVDPRFGVGNNPTMPTGWGGGSSSAPVEGGPGTFVAPSGDTTGSTDTATINNALTAAGNDGVPSVVYLDGIYYVNAPVVLQEGVTLRGSGWRNTVINLTAGANCDTITMNGTAYRFGLHDLAVDGHSESQTQTGNTTGCGVNLTGTAGSSNADSAGWRGGNMFNVSGIYTHFTKSDGVRVSGSVNEGRLWNCYTIRSGRNGFRIEAGTDFFAGGLTSGESQEAGINWNGDGRLLWSKSWWSGYCPPRGTNPNLSYPTNSNAPGYAIGGDGPQLIQCESQDSAGYGFDIGSAGGYYVIKADQSRNAHLRLMGHGAQIYMDVRPVAHGTTTPALVHPWNGRGNRVTISGWNGRVTTGTGAKAVVWPNSPTENDVIRTVQMGAAQHYTTYAATITPDYTLGGIKITLTGNITIADPIENINGAEAEVVLTQDGTGGRTVTWGAAYTDASSVNTGAGKVSRWTFRCMGTKWVQVGFVSY